MRCRFKPRWQFVNPFIFQRAPTRTARYSYEERPRTGVILSRGFHFRSNGTSVDVLGIAPRTETFRRSRGLSAPLAGRDDGVSMENRDGADLPEGKKPGYPLEFHSDESTLEIFALTD